MLFDNHDFHREPHVRDARLLENGSVEPDRIKVNLGMQAEFLKDRFPCRRDGDLRGSTVSVTVEIVTIGSPALVAASSVLGITPRSLLPFPVMFIRSPTNGGTGYLQGNGDYSHERNEIADSSDLYRLWRPPVLGTGVGLVRRIAARLHNPWNSKQLVRRTADSSELTLRNRGNTTPVGVPGEGRVRCDLALSQEES